MRVCGLDGSKQLGDVFSMLIVACYIFYTLGKVFLQRQLFAVVPDIVADKSTNPDAFEIFMKITSKGCLLYSEHL